MSTDIKIQKLILVGENFFHWGNKPCQQISMYYTVSLINDYQVPPNGTFSARDDFGNESIDLNFSWIPLSEISNIKIYPKNIKNDLISFPNPIKYFVYKLE